VGAERQTEKDRKKSWPDTRQQADKKDGSKKQHEWSTHAGQRDKPPPERERTQDHGERKQVGDRAIPGQDVQAIFHLEVHNATRFQPLFVYTAPQVPSTELPVLLPRRNQQFYACEAH
jgi:hypothetical protein